MSTNVSEVPDSSEVSKVSAERIWGIPKNAWLAAYVLYEVRRRLGDGWGVVLFPALTVLNEWIAVGRSTFKPVTRVSLAGSSQKCR